MPKFDVTGPDGRTFEIEAPEGATQDQIFGFAQQQFGTMKQKTDAAKYAGGRNVEDMNWLMRGLGGAKHAWDRSALGLKDVFTDLSPEDKELLEQGKAFVKEAGTAGKVGEIGTDIGVTLAPGSASYKGLQMLGKAGAQYLPKALAARKRLGNLLASVGSGAATNVLVSPEQSAGEAIFTGGVGGGVGDLFGRVLSRTVGGIVGRTSDEAKKLIEQGIDVPAWKATTSESFQRLGEAAKALPLVGKVLKAREQQAVRQWNEMLAREASPPVPVLDDAGRVIRWEQQPVKGAGTEALREAHGNFNKAYDALYQGRTIPVDDAFRSELDRINASAQAYLPESAPAIGGAIRRAEDTMLGAVEPTINRFTSGGQQLGRGKISSRITTPVQTVETTQLGHAGVNPNAIKQTLNDIEDSITAAWREGNKPKAKALEEVRDTITALRDRGLPPEVQSQLAPVNQAYARYKTLARGAATMGAQGTEGVVTPRQMLSAIRARDRSPDKSLFARGVAPGQQAALQAERVLGNELPSVGPGTAEKLMPWLTLGSLGTAGGAAMMGTDLGLLALLGTRQGQKMIAGRYPWQQKIAENPELLPYLLRNYGISQSD